MSAFIEWCNNNTGFVSAILSFVGVSISLIAIIISLWTARLPYKKKLAITSGTYFTTYDDEVGIHITVTNVGNRPVYIDTVGIVVNKQLMINKRTFSECRKMISTGESVTQYFTNQDLVKKMPQGVKKLYAYVKDGENKKYRRYICKTKDVISQ